MNDTFRLTVHWAERIVEVRWPVNPTIASWDRCEATVRKAVAELGCGWKILVDDSAVETMPEGMVAAVSAMISWALDHGLLMMARVANPGNASDVALRTTRKRAETARASGTPFVTREDAWSALTALTTPTEVRAVPAVARR